MHETFNFDKKTEPEFFSYEPARFKTSLIKLFMSKTRDDVRDDPALFMLSEVMKYAITNYILYSYANIGGVAVYNNERFMDVVYQTYTGL
jgi:hypothetical protein